MQTVSLRRILCLLLVSVSLAACNKAPPPTPPAPMVEVGHPEQKMISEWDNFAGRFRATEQVDVRARITGYIDQIRFTDGQMVKKGDVLFVIDQRSLKIAYARAHARAELTRKQYTRALALLKKQFIAKEMIDQRLQENKQAESELNDAKLNLDYSEVRSPITGKVGRHLLDVGNLAVSGDTGGPILTTVVASDPIQFYFTGSEKDLLKYIANDIMGHPVEIRLTEDDKTIYPGKIDFIDPSIDRNTGSVEIRAQLPNKNGRLVAGLFGRLRFAATKPYLAILIPENIIGTNQTQKFVYVLTKERTVATKTIELGPIYNKGMRIIRSGLTPSDNIIINGIAKIRPGMTVSVKK